MGTAMHKTDSQQEPTVGSYQLSSVLDGDLDGWQGQGVERSKREGIYVCLSVIHVVVQQKLIQHCKATMLLSHSVMSDSLQPHRLQSARLLCPWNFPGRNTGLGCHFLFQEIYAIMCYKLQSYIIVLTIACMFLLSDTSFSCLFLNILSLTFSLSFFSLEVFHSYSPIFYIS